MAGVGSRAYNGRYQQVLFSVLRDAGSRYCGVCLHAARVTALRFIYRARARARRDLKALVYSFAKYGICVEQLRKCFRSSDDHDATVLRVGLFRSFSTVCVNLRSALVSADASDWRPIALSASLFLYNEAHCAEAFAYSLEGASRSAK